MKGRYMVSRTLMYVVLLLLAIIFVFPVAWAFVSSLKPEAQIVSYPPVWIPKTPTLSNYQTVLTKYPFMQWMLSSVVVSVLSTAFVLILTSLAAYAFGRLEFKGKNVLFSIVISMLLIPNQVSVVPLFLLTGSLKLLNTWAAIILVAGANVTGVFILTSFFKTIPLELEEAAIIDGASVWTIFFRIILPLSTSALSSVTILTFISNWNNFLWPLVVIRDDVLKTLPVGIAQFMGGAGSNAQFQYGPSLAAACMAIVPSVVMFLIFQKNFVEGIASTGIKG